MSIRKYILKNIIVCLCIVSFLFVFFASFCMIFLTLMKFTDLNLGFLIHIIMLDNKAYFFLAAFLFAVLAFSAEFAAAYIITKLKFKNVEKSISSVYKKSDLFVKPTGINEIDLLLKKICSRPYRMRSTFFNENNLKGDILGVFEINKIRNQAIANKSAVKLLDIADFEENDDVYSFKADSIEAMIKNIKKFAYQNDNSLFFITFNDKMSYIKMFYSENETDIIGFFVDETKRAELIENYSQNKEKVSIENMLSKEDFLKQVEFHINENPDSIGCFAVIELDSLKIINDTYGYKVGDMYIHAVEKAMINQTLNCIFGKKSGYEFLIYFYDNSPNEDIRKKIENWINALNKEIFTAPDKREYKFKITAGYCLYPHDARNINELVKYSSYALYESRTMYYGSVHAFSLMAYNRAAYIENKLKRFYEIIDKNLLEYVFQPIVNLSDASVFGYEALMRTDCDDLKLPAEILEIAQSENMQYVIEKMTVFNCFEIVLKNKELFKDKRLFYNTIYNKILNNEDSKRINQLYSEVGYCLVPEVSESSADNYFYKKCASIKDNGDKIAIDNYTGIFADLKDIFKIKPDYIKIDSYLIRDINLKRDSQTFVSKLVKAAKENRVTTIAVGIETYAELKTLIRLGVNLGQGFYIARPNKEFIKKLNSDIENEIIDINNLN